MRGAPGKSQLRFDGGALACAAGGAVLFQGFGNAVRGYVDTPSVFWWWVSQWLDPNAETQHGWLILAISGFLLWRNLGAAGFGLQASGPEPDASRLKPHAWAAAAMATGLALHALGFAVQQTRISIVALLVFTWGVLALGGGPRWGRAAAFPLGFMVFAIPLNVLDTLGFWLRLGVIDASTLLARAAGVGVLRNGTQLLSPDGRYQYDVAAACSGVRSLMALAALALLVGYLTFRPAWLRGLMLLVSLPFVYLGNVVRITAIIAAAQLGGQGWGERVHDWSGFVVFLIVLGGVLAVGSLLRRFGNKAWQVEEPAPAAAGSAAPAPFGAPDPGRPAAAQPIQSRTRAAAGVGLVVLLLAGLEAWALARLAARPPDVRAGVVLAPDGLNPVELPAFIGTEWIGRRTEVTAVEREILPPDTGFSRKLYVGVADQSVQVFLSIVLSGRDRTSIHRPELCLVGQGWTITGATRHDFRHPSRPGASFPATVLHVQREVVTARGKVRVPQLVAYWFVNRDVVVATHGERVVRDAWDRLRLRSDRWAYVLVQADAADGEAVALARMQEVLDRTLPAFQPLPAAAAPGDSAGPEKGL
jgi:EpsI family protein